MRRILTYCLLLQLLSIVGCKKLPKETHKGKGTMACYVDGKKWVAKDKIFPLFNFFGGNETPNATIHKADSALNINGSTKKESNGSISIGVIGFIGTGEYQLKDSRTPSSYASYMFNSGGDYHTDSTTNTGVITIKFYTDKIIAGTFSFTAANANGEVISASEGRFDIEYELK